MEIPVAADLADIKKDIKTLASNQEKLIALIEPLLESIQCKQCLRSMYKVCIISYIGRLHVGLPFTYEYVKSMAM